MSGMSRAEGGKSKHRRPLKRRAGADGKRAAEALVDLTQDSDDDAQLLPAAAKKMGAAAPARPPRKTGVVVGSGTPMLASLLARVLACGCAADATALLASKACRPRCTGERVAKETPEASRSNRDRRTSARPAPSTPHSLVALDGPACGLPFFGRCCPLRVNCYGPTVRHTARIPTCRLRTTADAVRKRRRE